MGSVSPLLAIKQEINHQPKDVFLWLGTKNGPEKEIVQQAGIKYVSVPSGKLRRYWSWKNFTDIVLIISGFFKALWLIYRFQPDIVLTAGSFVCVPVVMAAAVLRKKIIVHQQDLVVGLANKIMKPFAHKITVSFDEMSEKFNQEKVVVTGNPVRKFLFDANKNSAVKKFNLQEDLPTVLIVGGGKGSQIINEIFINQAKQFTEFCQIIHVLGKGAQSMWLNHPLVMQNSNYHTYEFLTDEMAAAYAAADLVVCRSGLSTLTELSALQKPTITIPIPNNQQVANAKFFNEKKAVVYVRQEDLAPQYIIDLIKDLLTNQQKLKSLTENIYNIMPQNSASKYVDLIYQVVKPIDKQEKIK